MRQSTLLNRPRLATRWAGVFIALAATGCGSGVDQPGGMSIAVGGSRDTSVVGLQTRASEEPNDTFAQARPASFDSEGRARLIGTIADPGDLDVFILGKLVPGDRVLVDADTLGSPLDVSIALFDDQQRLVFNNDDRGGVSDRALDSLIDFVVRHGGDRYALVVTRSAFADRADRTGDYVVDVQVLGGFSVPEPVEQVVLLDFDGAEVDSPVLGRVKLDPFDAAALSSIYRGQTQTIKDSIRATFEDNFARFNVRIVTTDDPPLSSSGSTAREVSTVYFGGFNPQAFGVADGVDLYNLDFCDDALIFVETFSPALFSTPPTASEMGVAIGNVGSHEAGHLLGLNHVDDDRALMDDQSDTNVFLENQEFIEAPLSRDIMPIGTQDSVLLLNEIVGPRSRLSPMIASRRPQ